CFLLPSSASAQFLYPFGSRVTEQPHNPLLASYALANVVPAPIDTVPMAFAQRDASTPGRKSGFLAAALSLVIPGLGEYYVGDHVWRGMIFTGMEAGLWLGYIHWNQRGDNAQNSFYNFSAAHFSRGRYAGHLDSLLLSDTQWARTLYPIDRADSGNIASINRAEAALDSLKNISSGQVFPNLSDSDYTHRLIDPDVDFQQYNEMISKYWQYISGWDQMANWSTASFMRADAQHQYDIARDFLFGIFLNHALSALDAALLARDHNSPIHLHGDLIERSYPDGTIGFIPTASVEYRF
ncbi:MAG: hypothetical protein ACHQNE_08655, partial [Candidatus Kapaibacterium sp.]